MTLWGYNSAGFVDWMTHPADDQGNSGERLDFGYLPQLLLSVITSTILGMLTTLSCDAPGQLVERELGSQGLASAHAVTSLSNANSYSYDANGNMTQRVINSQTYSLT